MLRAMVIRTWILFSKAEINWPLAPASLDWSSLLTLVSRSLQSKRFCLELRLPLHLLHLVRMIWHTYKYTDFAHVHMILTPPLFCRGSS